MPTLQVKLSGVSNLATIHNVEGVPTLRVLSQAFGEKFASRVWLKTQILIVNDFVSVKEKLDDMQIDTLSDQILIQYGNLNLFELCCFFSRLRSGFYEKFYGSVDPAQILSSLRKFCQDRERDLGKEIEKAEKAERDKWWNDWEKRRVTFIQWASSQPEEYKEKLRKHYSFLKSIIGEKEMETRKAAWHIIVNKIFQTHNL